MDRTRQAVAVMAREDPALAARLVIQTLPAAAAKVPGKLTYGLVVEELGEYTVVIDSGRAEVLEGLNGERTISDLIVRGLGTIDRLDMLRLVFLFIETGLVSDTGG